jgi:glutaredoxin 3
MNIEIYSKVDCPYCVRAKNLFRTLMLEYKEYIVPTDISREEFLQKFKPAKTVPQIIVDGEHIGGYNDLIKDYRFNLLITNPIKADE